MSKARDLANLISTGNVLSDGAISVSEITDLTASAAELNKLDGVTATTAELNQVVGATSALQTQLDNISVTSGSLTKTFTQNETADITLSQGITSAPVVSATKEVPQAGISTKGNWDVNSTASNYDFHNTAANVTLTPSVSSNSQITSLTYASKTGHVNGNDTQAIHFKSDGTKVFSSGSGGSVYEHSLSTAWDLSTISYSKAFAHNGYMSNARGMYWKPDGTKFYLVGNNDTAFEFDVNSSYPWDLSYASYNNKSININSQHGTGSQGIFFKPDGTKMFITDYTNNHIGEWALSTAWDISTAAHTRNANVLATPKDIVFNSNGTVIYIVTAQKITEYNCSTAYDLSTMSTPNRDFTISGQSTGLNAQGLAIKPDDTEIFTVDASDNAYEYNFGTTSVVTLGSGSFASTDVGKRIVGNGGDVILTSTSGAFDTTGGSAFTDNSTIAAGSWQMFGLKSAGDADGITMPFANQIGAGFNTTAALESTTPSSINSSYLGAILDCCVSKDGNYLYTINQASNAMIRQFTMSTPYDLSTASYTRQIQSGVNASNTGISMNNDGTKMYVTYNQSSQSYLKTYALSTAYDISTMVNTNNNVIPVGSNDGQNSQAYGGKLKWNNDGSKAYYQPYAQWSGAPNSIGASAPSGNYNPSGVVYQYNLSTPFDWAGSSPSVNATVRVPHSGSSYAASIVSSDGNWLINVRYNTTFMFVYPLTTPYDISTQNVAGEIFIDTQARNSSGRNDQGGIGLDHVNGILYNVSYGQSRVDANRYATNQSTLTPTQQYNVAVTNSGGQIDSQYFTDINSMTAAQSAGSGTVNYAVSTDGRTTWSVAKGTSGVRPIVRNNSGTWQYNSQNTSTTTGYDFSTFAYANSTLSTTGYNLNDLAIKSDGTQIYWIDNNGRVRQQTLSTAYDLSTAGAMTFFDQTSQDNDPRDVTFKPDGTKMYLLGDQNNSVFQYTLSTAWDVTTASYDSKSFAVSGQMSAPMSVQFKSDGLIMYIKENTNIFQYNLSTAWDVSTASYANKSFNNQSQDSDMLGMYVKPDATQLYAVGYSNDKIYVYNFGTAGDLATLTYSNNSYSLDSNNGVARGITLSSDGTKIYTADYSGQKIFQYNIGSSVPDFVLTPTWTNGTVNDELYTLQQALSIGANRMDKTQLDAVADANHFPTGTSLDLMIALRQDTANASSLPKSDGVTLNYDGAVLNEGAVLGTDYDFFFPSSTKVQIKSLAAQNLKVRVV